MKRVLNSFVNIAKDFPTFSDVNAAATQLKLFLVCERLAMNEKVQIPKRRLYKFPKILTQRRKKLKHFTLLGCLATVFRCDFIIAFSKLWKD